jgi:hypothetical protein
MRTISLRTATEFDGSFVFGLTQNVCSSLRRQSQASGASDVGLLHDGLQAVAPCHQALGRTHVMSNHNGTVPTSARDDRRRQAPSLLAIVAQLRRARRRQLVAFDAMARRPPREGAFSRHEVLRLLRGPEYSRQALMVITCPATRSR